MRRMGMTASEYWRVILVETWKAAWSKTRSWAALWAIAIGATGLYLYAVEDWRPLLAWIVQQQFSSSLELLDTTFDPQQYAFALPNGSPLRGAGSWSTSPGRRS
jgi:hypothetical protein